VLTPDERALIVDQAIVLLESFYAHLPLKRAMHAIDPLQRLRLLRHRLAQFTSELSFHAEMTDIFTSLRDLHTNYLLPTPFRGMAAALPFRVEACFGGGVRKFLVAGVQIGFTHPTFIPGVEVRYWNGTPIERAVEIAAARHAGSNADARLARGVAGLTARALSISPPPDEEWVIVGYRTSDGRDLDFRADWIVTGLPEEGTINPEALVHEATALGLDLETDAIRQIHKLLYAPQVVAASAKLAAADDALALVQGTDSVMPGVLQAKVANTSHGDFGYIRIFTFNVNDAETFVAEFVRLAALLPQNGLIIDVRDNGGGLIYAGEQLLQVLTPRQIEPERLQFINTALNLRLCQLHETDFFKLGPWIQSIESSIETGATFSASFPMTSPDACNAIGQRYFGPVVLVTSARSYSTTDFFAAGFQDHGIGPVLGVDNHTGAGGANVWQHDLLRKLFERPDAPGTPLPDSPFKDLPRDAGMRVAIRRSLRVGPRAGTEVEDLGVTPDELHQMTSDDLLYGNRDLIEHAASLLARRPVYALAAKAAASPTGGLALDVTIKGITQLDVFVNGQPRYWQNVADGTVHIDVGVPAKSASLVDVRGFANAELVAARRIKL